MPLDFDLYIDQGSDFTIDLVVTTTGYVAQNLTGYTVVGKMRRSFFALTSFDLGAVISDPVNGVVTLNIPAAVSTLYWPTRYVYDVLVTNSTTGVTSRVFEGLVTVTPGVTGVYQEENYEMIVYAPGAMTTTGSSVLAFTYAIY